MAPRTERQGRHREYHRFGDPGRQLSVYDGVGHSPFYEDAPRFNAELAAFVRAANKGTDRSVSSPVPPAVLHAAVQIHDVVIAEPHAAEDRIVPTVAGALVPLMRDLLSSSSMTRAPSGLPDPPTTVRAWPAALDHFRRRLPGRRFRLAGDVTQPDQLGALLAEPDAVAQRHVVGLNQIEKMLQPIDDDSADRLEGR